MGFYHYHNRLRGEYEKHRLLWMADRGFSLDLLVYGICTTANDLFSEEFADKDSSIGQVIEESWFCWQDDVGFFGGCIWPCLQEWLEEQWAEFGDVPIVLDDDSASRIDAPFLCYPQGTEQIDIWQDFDELYEHGVYGLMFPGNV